MDLAAILGNIDTDIAAIEAELVKARQLKQGRMQELIARMVCHV